MKIFILLLFPVISYAQVFVGPRPELTQKIEKFKKNNFNKSDLNKDKNIHLFSYLEAKNLQLTDNSKACLIYKKLSSQKNFIFKNLSHLKAYETCENYPFEKINLKPWMSKTYKKIKFDRCLDSHSKECIGLYISKSKKKLPQTEKIAYINTALAKAQKLNNKKLIQQAKARLIKVSPKYKKNISKNDYLIVAKDHLKARDFIKANKYYADIINQNFSLKQKIDAYRGLSKSKKLERKYKEYVAKEKDLFNFVYETFKKNKKLISYKLLDKTCQSYARATWSYKSRVNAEKTLKTCIRELKGKFSLAAIYWIQGRIEEEKKNYQFAINLFEKASLEKSRNPDFKDKVSWYQAWNEKKLKQPEKALVTLSKLIKNTNNRFSRAKFKFWKGKLLTEINKKNEANKVFEDIIKESPSSFYSLLSHKFLNRKISYNKSDQASNLSEKIKNKLNLEYIDWLLLVDEDEFAQEYLKHKIKKSRKTFKEDEIKYVFPYYAKTNLYLEFFYLVSILAPDRQNNLLLNNPELLFPQPYKSLVTNSSEEFKFNSNIVYSIMRQESAFNPKARSFADAFGLLQLIPEVASHAHRSINSSYKTATDLYSPKLNIKLGSFYLKQQWALYKNQFVLASASYNATDRAIKSWVKSRFAGSTLEFIEDIPYEETRNYVKLVMRNYIFYKLVNSDGAIDFPEYCLNMKSL